MADTPFFNRRSFLTGSLAVGGMFWTTRGAFAEELIKTPDQTEGPFYPTKLPLDTDNDLLVINDAMTPGVGEITHFSGKILDAKGNPIRGALVEIWQCDANGAYLHPRSDNGNKRDKNFQGFGRFLTGSTGEYYFRTIKPVPYPGRTPHIHVKVKKGGKQLLATQAYIKDHPQNKEDHIFMSVRDEKVRAITCAEYVKVKGSKIGEWAANYNVVLGVSPEMS